MDQGWKWFPLLVVLLIFWRSALGFPGGVHSKTGLWGQTSGDTFSPREVQSLSEAPVTGSASVDQVGYGLFTDGRQTSGSKFAYERQYVNGGVSSSNEATSRIQTAPSGSVSAALAQPQGAGSLTLLHPQVSTSSSVPGIASQLSSGQSLPSQYSAASSQTSPVQQSAGGSSQNFPLLGVVSSGQLVFEQEVSGGYSGSSQDIPTWYSPSSLTTSKLSSLPVGGSSQPTSDTSVYLSGAPSQSSTMFATSSYGPVQTGSSYGDLSFPKPQGAFAQFAPATKYVNVAVTSPQDVSTQSGSNQGLYRPVAQVVTSPQTGLSSQFVSPQGGSGAYSGTLAQSQVGSFGDSKSITFQTSSRPINVAGPQGVSSTTVGGASSFSGPVPSRGTFSQFALGSPSKFSSSQLVSSQSTSDPGLYSQYSPTSVIGPQTGTSAQFTSSQGESNACSGYLPQSQSGSSELSFGSFKPIPPRTVSTQQTSVASSQGISGTTLAGSSRFASQATSSGFSDSLQSRGTSSQLADRLGSPTYSKLVSSQSTSDPGLYSQYSPTSLIGPQTGTSAQFVSSRGESSACSGYLPQSQQTSVASSQGSSGTTLAGSSRFSSQATSGGFGGSLQSQGTSSQLASGSPTYSKLSSSRLGSSQSSSDPGLYGQLSPTSQVGSPPQKGASHRLAASQGSGYYSGSLTQSQGSFGPYAPSSPSKYVPMSSPQSVSHQAAAAPTSHGMFASTAFGGFGSQSGSSLALQGSSAEVGSTSRPQGTVSQFAPGSPSRYASASLSSAQGASSQCGPVSQSQRLQRPQPSTTSWTQGIQTSDAAVAPSQNTQIPSRLSSPSSAGGFGYPSGPQVPSGGSGQLFSEQGGSGSYGGVSLPSSSTSSLYTPGSPAYAKLGSSPLGLSSQSNGDRGSSSLYSSSFQSVAGSAVAPSRYASLQTGSSDLIGSYAQPQSVYSQYAPAPSSLDAKAPVSSQYSQASQGGSSLSLSQQSQKWQPSASSLSQGARASDASALQRFSSAQMSSGFSSPQFAVSSSVASVGQSGQSSTSAALRPQSGVQRHTRLISSSPGSTVGGQMLQHSTDSSLTPSLSSSGHLSAMGVFSGSSLPQTAQTPGQYGSESYNQGSGTSVADEYATFQMFSNYGRDAPGSRNYPLRRDASVKG